MGGQAPNLQPGTGFYVTIATPKGSQTKKIEGDTLSVGRAEDCNLTIAHETLSRRHMTVLLRNGQCWVEDHGSSNGTFVNGKRLKPHTPSRVLPEDFVQLGQSGVRLSVSTEPQMWKGAEEEDPVEKTEVSQHTQTHTKTNAPPPVGQKPNTIVTSTMNERKLARQTQAAELKVPAIASEEAERLVQEAQKKAAALIQEAELDAERRVEDIYRRAHETQAKMDEVYQRRLNEAYRSAEKIFQKSQSESEIILNEARQKSAEIRTQAEGFVMELRRRTEEDCERILDEAQQTARELKESRLAEADEMIRKKEDELIKNTRDAMSTRLARFEDDLVKEAARQREVLETELTDRRALLEQDSREQSEAVAKLKAEVSQLTDARETILAKLNGEKERAATDLLEAEQKIEKHTAEAALMKTELEGIRKEILEGQGTLGLMRGDIERYSKLREEARVASEKVKNYDEDIAGELLRMRERFAEDKAKLQRSEEKHLEEMKLATTRKVKLLEDQMLQELTEKRGRIAREINLMIETHLKENPKATGKALKPLQEDIAHLFDRQITTMSKDPGAKEKQRTLVALKGREKARATVFGILVGVAIAFGGQRIQSIVKAEQSPMARRVSAVQEERKQDLERRKFNPEQTLEMRPTYTDSVIYTKDFAQKYMKEDFQRKFLQSVTPFLLKTWRIEEDKVIQLLATSSALVKTLHDRREGIHPDFVPQGIEKMREIEAEALGKMRVLLGSHVRVESFRKFEKKFYEDYPR